MDGVTFVRTVPSGQTLPALADLPELPASVRVG